MQHHAQFISAIDKKLVQDGSANPDTAAISESRLGLTPGIHEANAFKARYHRRIERNSQAHQVG